METTGSAQALEIAFSGDNTWQYVTQDISVIPGATLTLGVWLRAEVNCGNYLCPH